MKRGFGMCIFIGLISPIVMASASDGSQINHCLHLKNTPNIPSDSSQIILVQSKGGIKAKITACQRHANRWTQVFATSWIGSIGENGIAVQSEKKEGDRKTPAGLYALGEAFGTKPLSLKMDFKYITPEDKFVDDPNHTDYNRWISGDTDAKTYEVMSINSYKMGLVIRYNMSPIIPGAGSAIFMHLQKEPNTGTAGCITMDESHLLSLLHWLDKKQHPYISIR